MGAWMHPCTMTFHQARPGWDAPSDSRGPDLLGLALHGSTGQAVK